MRIIPLRELIKSHPLEYKFKEDDVSPECKKIYINIKTALLQKPILQRADAKKRFYLKTDFSSKGLGFELCQPDDSPDATEAMKSEDAGGE